MKVMVRMTMMTMRMSMFPKEEKDDDDDDEAVVAMMTSMPNAS